MSTPGSENDPSDSTTPRDTTPKHADGPSDRRDPRSSTPDDGDATQAYSHVTPSSENDPDATQAHTHVTPRSSASDPANEGNNAAVTKEQHYGDGQPTEVHRTTDSDRTREHRTQPDGMAGAVATGAGAGAAASPSTRTQPVTAQPVSHTADPDDARYRDAQDDRPALPASAERAALLQHEKDTFGGMKFGSAFFGWLTATGMAVLLTAFVAAAGAVFGLSTNTDLTDAADQVAADPQTVGITGAIVLLVILLLSYFAGGYVAGRMARFNGAKQGVAVWLWALIIAVLVAILGLIFGSQFDILANLNSFPRIPLNEGNLTTTGIIAVVVAIAAALIGAVLGGLTGMRYHRRIDRADYENTTTR
ncbi:YrzE family protein [Arthrobacter sp. 260]|uniref:YrzE family protein n=1 Tax=Arthrobacter sp. 260 TaxID=2735314 RepID=UPI00320A3BD5